jgi:chromosome segregation ATPase
MKKVISETDSVNSRLAAEVDSLRKQLQFQQTPSKLEKDKEKMLNELKKSIEDILSEKNKLAHENSKLVAAAEKERQQAGQEALSFREKIYTLTIQIQTLEGRLAQGDLDSYKRRVEDLSLQIANLIKERDLMRSQHDAMRSHLEEETKRAIYIESQLIKSSQQSSSNNNYLIAKI